MGNVGDDVTFSGRPFHVWAATTWNILLPILDSLNDDIQHNNISFSRLNYFAFNYDSNNSIYVFILYNQTRRENFCIFGVSRCKAWRTKRWTFQTLRFMKAWKLMQVTLCRSDINSVEWSQRWDRSWPGHGPRRAAHTFNGTVQRWTQLDVDDVMSSMNTEWGGELHKMRWKLMKCILELINLIIYITHKCWAN